MANGFDKIKEALHNINPATLECKDEDSTGIIAQELEKAPNSITLDTSLWNTTGSYNIGIGSAAGNYITSSGLNGYNWGINTNTASNPSTLKVDGNAEFEGDVKIKGVSLYETLDTITKRLAILVPDPAKLEHFEALQKAYNNYKTLEALCDLPKETKE